MRILLSVQNSNSPPSTCILLHPNLSLLPSSYTTPIPPHPLLSSSLASPLLIYQFWGPEGTSVCTILFFLSNAAEAATQPWVWGKFCLFGFCLFSFGLYAVGLSPIRAVWANDSQYYYIMHKAWRTGWDLPICERETRWSLNSKLQLLWPTSHIQWPESYRLLETIQIYPCD